MSVESAEFDIIKMCNEVEKLLCYKNKMYGDTVANPISIFSKMDAKNGMLVRIDDKLARIKNCGNLRKNDVIDLIGYLIRLSIEEGWTDLSEFYE